MLTLSAKSISDVFNVDGTVRIADTLGDPPAVNMSGVTGAIFAAFYPTAATTVTAGAIEADDNIYTKVAHGFVTGQKVVLNSLTGGTGLTAGGVYYFHRLSADTGYLCASRTAALAGTAINVTLDATSVSLSSIVSTLHVASAALVWGNATVRLDHLFGSSFSEINAFILGARRKPGTTGAIAAQSILVEGWDSVGYEKIGHIEVSAVAADDEADPESDFIFIPRHNGDTHLGVDDASHPIKFSFDAADTDLEIFLKIWGVDAD